jgi:DNA-binding NarL/FixJ family response regulator
MAVALPCPQPLRPSLLVAVEDDGLLERLCDAVAGDDYRVFAPGSHDEARWLVEHDDIDLVLCDTVELAAAARRANPRTIRVVLATTPSLDSAVRAINDAHVHRYVIGPWQPEALRATLREALAGAGPRATPRPRHVELSPRLRDTLDALMTGASEKQIASVLGISHHTAHEYVKALYRRFGVTSRPELMATVLRAPHHGAVSTTS